MTKRSFLQCSHEENFEWLNRIDDSTQAVKIANPKTLEFQVVRTSLIPGLLKTIRENRGHSLPIRVFETADVVVKDTNVERQARNVRHAAAVWCNKTAGFEVVHGLLNRLMQVLEIPRIAVGNSKVEMGYYIRETDGVFPDECNLIDGAEVTLHPYRCSLLSGPCRQHLLSYTPIQGFDI